VDYCDPGCVVYASQLEYTHPPEDSFVILAGCESFKPGKKKEPSALSKALTNADLSGGFSKSIYPTWPNIYLSAFFAEMAGGSTASEANDAAWSQYNQKIYKFVLDNLHFVGDTSFRI